MSFKEMIAEELDIFLDLDEFGEEINIDGTTFTAIKSTGTEDITGAYDEELKEGVYKKVTTLYIKTSDIQDIYEQGKKVELDGLPYTVYSSDDQDGITEIKLQEHAVW
ncbi:hypothetical protein [Ilyobacter sp.]|uniref:hypothetical protein n=1 Tax=Ilyobacter sp. TaxID=3100343 RepID=UPI00356A0078